MVIECLKPLPAQMQQGARAEINEIKIHMLLNSNVGKDEFRWMNRKRLCRVRRNEDNFFDV